MFGARITAALIAKGVRAPDAILTTAAERIIPPRSRNGTLAYLTSESFNPGAVEPEASIVAQNLLANLVRHGVSGIRMPTCPSCRRERVLRMRDDQGRRICFRCSERRHYGECPVCRRMKKLTATNTDGSKICLRCTPGAASSTPCTRCRRASAAGSRLDGDWLCLNCYPKRSRTCVSCGEEKKIAATILHGPHCFACHNRALRNARPCPSCGQFRILAFLDDAKQAVCAGCAGQPARYACRRCGSEQNHYGRLCGVCVLDDRCRELLAGPDGAISASMDALRVYLLAKPRPAQTIKWLRRGPQAELLRSIALGNTPLDETAFTSAEGDKGLTYLRNLLIDAGALPRPQAAARLEAWAARAIAPLPSDRRKLLTTYVRWVLLRRARRDHATGDIAPGAVRHVQVTVRGIMAFFSWLDDRRTPLAAVTQTEVEEFLTTRSARRWLPQFLAWATERDVAPDVEVHALRPALPNITTSEEAHESTIRTLTLDETIPIDVRLPALLLAVYGLPASKALTLRREQLHPGPDGSVELTVGDHPLRLPKPLAALARAQLNRHADSEAENWLFPGSTPGRPRDPQYLTSHLRRLGTGISMLQKTARFRLAGAIPAKVLADILDFHVSTFETYAHLAAGIRGDYPTLRAIGPE